MVTLNGLDAVFFPIQSAQEVGRQEMGGSLAARACLEMVLQSPEM